MAAPNGTIWGSIVKSYGRIGVYPTVTTLNGVATVTVEIWFWSKYSVSDSANTLYGGLNTTSGAAQYLMGSMDINTEVASGTGWSTANQQKLATITRTVKQETSALTRYAVARLINVDRVGAEMTVSAAVTIPKLTTYSVKYNANGGSGAPSAQTKYYGNALTLSSTKPTRTGYIFQGWGTSASTTTVSYAPGASYTANAAITLYAIWKVVTYTISYNANGGTGAPSNQTKTYGVTLKLSTTKPTRTNYDFLGWGTSANATTATFQPGGSFTNNGATTLYAVWRLSYAKPRVNNFSISRCNEDGTTNDSGTYALISFDWACDRELSSITVKLDSETSDAQNFTISASGTSGTVSQVIGGSFATDQTYAVTLVVTDTQDSTYIFDTLAGTKFVVDFKAGGNGVAFGKPAELDDTLDIGYQTRFFGGLLPVVLDPETDLNTVLTPNTYTGANISHYNYANCPVTSGTFTLIVESCGEAGQIRQTYISCSKFKPERFVRFYYQLGWGDWFWAGTEEYVLFSIDEGTNGVVNLSASLANYRYIEIYFTDNNGKSGGYTKVYSPNGKTICLDITETSSTTSILHRQTMYTLSGTTMTPNTTVAGYIQFNPSTKVISNSPTGTNYIKIVRVIGRA